MNIEAEPSCIILGNYHIPKTDKLRNLSMDEVKQFSDSKDTLFHYDNVDRLLRLVEMNHQELQAFILALEQDKPGMLDPQLNADRLVMNYLSSCKAYEEHLQPLTTRFAKDIKRQVKQYRNQSFAYRFLYKLRNYSQHQACPVHEVSINIGDNKPRTVRLISRRDKLLDAEKWWGEVVRDLKNLSDNDIELLDLIKEHYTLLMNTRRTIFDANAVKDLAPAVEFMRGLFNEVKITYSEGTPCLITQWEEVDNRIKISFETIPDVRRDKSNG